MTVRQAIPQVLAAITAGFFDDIPLIRGLRPEMSISRFLMHCLGPAAWFVGDEGNTNHKITTLMAIGRNNANNALPMPI